MLTSKLTNNLLNQGKEKKDPERDVRERRDSRGSNDRERDWDQVRAQEEREPVTPDRTRKRLSSFEDIKVKTFLSSCIQILEEGLAWLYLLWHQCWFVCF